MIFVRSVFFRFPFNGKGRKSCKAVPMQFRPELAWPTQMPDPLIVALARFPWKHRNRGAKFKHSISLASPERGVDRVHSVVSKDKPSLIYKQTKNNQELTT